MQVAVEHWFRPCYIEYFFLRKLLLACQMTVGSHSSTVSHTSVSYISSVWHKSTSSGLLWLYKLISWGTGLKKQGLASLWSKVKNPYACHTWELMGIQQRNKWEKVRGQLKDGSSDTFSAVVASIIPLAVTHADTACTEVLLDRCLGF